MESVRDIAARYGTSTAFVVKALARLAVHVEGPGSPVSPQLVEQFESVFGERIRAARPPETPHADTKLMADQALAVARKGSGRHDAHAIRVAFSHVSGRRNSHLSEFVPILSDTPGLAHAIDASATNDGDPWGFDLTPNPDHRFYSHPGPYAACGERVRALMSEVFEPDRADACPRCSRSVRQSKAFRDPPFSRPPPRCHESLWVGVSGRETCDRIDHHIGRHQSRSGASWLNGIDDYAPAPPHTDR